MMVDHNVLKDEISSATRYRKLQDIRASIPAYKRRVPLTISAELEGRVNEKLMTFDYPICSAARIRVIFTNGLSKPLDPEECHYAMSRGMKLSDYIFSRYISARDFEIEDSNVIGTRSLGIYSETAKEELTPRRSFTELTPGELRERIEFLMKKVETIERIGNIYAQNIPKMARDVNDMKAKMDLIYKKVIGE